jgi:hypothetical protein
VIPTRYSWLISAQALARFFSKDRDSMFKNATLYLTQGLPDTADQLGQRLAAQSFMPCSATQI